VLQSPLVYRSYLIEKFGLGDKIPSPETRDPKRNILKNIINDTDFYHELRRFHNVKPKKFKIGQKKLSKREEIHSFVQGKSDSPLPVSRAARFLKQKVCTTLTYESIFIAKIEFEGSYDYFKSF
jgi:hypothetical protein